MSPINWISLITNLSIAIAYFAIPVFMIRFIRLRDDLPFSNMWFLFGAFIASCGIGHAIHGLAVFWPALHHYVQFWHIVTACISCLTAYKLPSLLKIAMEIPSPEQLRKINKELSDVITKNFQKIEADR